MSRKWRPFAKGKSPAIDDEPSASSSTLKYEPNIFRFGIKQWGAGEGSVVDIVFVHGLRGDREETWRSPTAAAPWPQTLLPSKIPNARVLTFGYNAYVADWRGMVSKSRIANHAMNLLTSLATFREDDETNERPILFVCHSLGGLVCEDSLVLSQQRPQQHLKNIVRLTRGIVFLGTPHHGSGLARWAEKVAGLVGVMKETNPEILGVLRQDSEVLARIQDAFHTMIIARHIDGLTPVNITCFYEELPVLGLGLIVPQDSAILPGYIPIGIHRNHMDLTKFEHEDDPGFRAVTGELRRWVKTLSQSSDLPKAPEDSISPAQGTTQQQTWFIVPFTSNPGFVGRSDTLEKLQTRFSFGERERTTSQTRVALFGLGGIGKTQIALAYAYWTRRTFPKVSIFWIHAGTEERFYQGMAEIAQKCLIPGHDDPKANIPMLVKAWLENVDRSEWLLILDNADDTNVFFGSDRAAQPTGASIDGGESEGKVARFIPECPHGSILVTTRNKETGSRLTRYRGLIQIGEMSLAESIELIQGVLEDDQLNHEDLARLSEQLEYLPLALVQAAAFVQENSITIAKYLQILEQSDNNLINLLSKPFEAVGRDSGVPHAVALTWVVSFQQISHRYPEASYLLSLMCFFNRQGIPKAFLSRECIPQGDKYNGNDAKLPGGAANRADRALGAVELEMALGVLKAFSFISENSDNENFNIHRLVQLVMQKWLIRQNPSHIWFERALTIVASLFPSGAYENWKICEEYMPHAYAVLDPKTSSSMTEAESRGLLLCNVAYYLDYRGQQDTPRRLLGEAIPIIRGALGENHRVTLTSKSVLARIDCDQGRYEEAEAMQLQLVETGTRVLGAEDLDTLAFQSDLASTYTSQTRWDDAEELLVKVLETQKKISELEDHKTTLPAMNTLSLVYESQGKLKEAEQLRLQVRETSLKALGTEHPYTLTSLHNLAVIYQRQGRLEEAEELQLQVKDTRLKVLGAEHPGTLACLHNLAFIYQGQGRLKEAEELGLKVLETKIRVLGPRHPSTLSCTHGLAVTLMDLGRHTEACTLMEDCARLYEEMLGAHHPDTQNAASWVAKWKSENPDWFIPSPEGPQTNLQQTPNQTPAPSGEQGE